MNALLLIAHGSQRKASNEAVAEITRSLNTEMSEQFPIIEYAFLEIAEPSIVRGIERCALQGATQLHVVPYFLNAGRHVSEDVPTIVATAAKYYPTLSISIAPHVGASKLMLAIIKESATQNL